MKYFKLYTIALFALTLGLCGCKKEGEQKTQKPTNTVVAAYPIVKDVEIKTNIPRAPLPTKRLKLWRVLEGILKRYFSERGPLWKKELRFLR